MAAEFHTITVKEIEKTTSDCSIITLDIPGRLKEEFKYIQGQYLTFKKDINNEDIRRSYSLCSSPLDDEWKVGIKKVENGRFSTYANEVLQEGDTVEVMAPTGNFYIETDANADRDYIAFAAGSGITPILSIIKTHLQAEPHSSFKLFYTNQRVSSIILKEELEALKNIYMGRFEIFHFLTKQNRGIPLYDGRIDIEKLDTIFSVISDPKSIDHVFSCGPEAMIFLVRDYLLDKGLDKSQIHYELFGSSADTTSVLKEEIKKQLQGKVCDITIIEGGKSMDFSIEQGSNNLLDAALDNNADLPFACKGGVCATCKAKLIEGKVNMLLSYGLEEDEIEKGYILTCQAIPTTDKVIVDFDV